MRKRQASPWNSCRLKRPQPARLHHFIMARSQKSLEGKFTFNIKKLRIQV